MKWSFQIGKIFGIPIRVHITFLLLLLFVGMLGGREGEGFGGVYGMLVIILVFACVVLHEIGHSLMAQHYGFKVRSITLLPIGGVSQIEEMPEEPHQEIYISIIGPIVSLSLALIFYFIALSIYQTIPSIKMAIEERKIFATLFWINLILGIFNLAPAFPLDGGRILRGFLARVMEHLKATKIAVSVGQFVAILLFFIGIFYNWWLALIAIFIYLGAEAEEHMAVMRTALRKIPVRQAMLTNVETVSPEETLGEVLDKVCHSFQSDFPVIAHDNLVGILTKDKIFSSLKSKSPATRVDEIMDKEFDVTTEDEPLEKIYQKMTSRKLSVIPVMQNQLLKGMINLEQIGKYHMISAAGRK